MATSAQIRALVINFANGVGGVQSGFQAIQDVTDAINPPLNSLANFDGFVVSLANAMAAGGARFTAFPQQLINAVTWDDLVTQIALHQV